MDCNHLFHSSKWSNFFIISFFVAIIPIKYYKTCFSYTKCRQPESKQELCRSSQLLLGNVYSFSPIGSGMATWCGRLHGPHRVESRSCQHKRTERHSRPRKHPPSNSKEATKRKTWKLSRGRRKLTKDFC